MEKITKPISGYLMVLAALLLLALAIFFFTSDMHLPGLICGLAFIFIIPGFFIVEPNKSMVLLLFGAYQGTVKAFGFFWVIPFMTRNKIS